MAVSYGTYTITEVQEGSQIWTTTVAPVSPDYTFTISNLTGDSDTSVKVGDIIMYSYYRYTVLSISSDGTTVLTGNRVSIRGATGAASVTYTLIVSNLAIIKDKDGNLSPSTITVTAKSQTGSNAMANYTGRIKIETTTDNSTWTSRINEDAATKTYTIPSDTVAIRCSLYLKGGTTTLLDQQTIPVVSDGVDGTNGTNGADAYTVILTNENHTFTGNTTSALASEIECNVIAYKGATQVASTIGTITGQPTGMTTSLLNNGTVNSAFKVTVTTSMVTRNGVLSVPITVDGKTFTKEFTYTLTLDGEKGDKGDTAQWYYGELLTHTSGTATLPISQTEDVAVGAMYLNTKTGTCYKCTAISGTNATWKYAGNITDGIEVGGRNLIHNSTNFNKWYVQNDGAEGEIWHKSASGNTSNINAKARTWIGTGYLADYYNKTITISFEIMSPDWSAINAGITGLNGLAIQLETATGVPYSNIDSTGRYFFKRLGEANYFKLDSDLVNGKWVKVTSIPLKIDDSFWTSDTTKVDGYDNFTFSFLLRRNGEISFRKLKIELGNKATDFTLAPEDIKVDIEEAKKVATNYLSMDSTGIMVADMNDGEQKPSEATGRNVFIDNDSVDIRNGTTTLASFTGDNTKFYDPIYNKELATFGASGAMIGVEGEQRFVIEKDSVRAINSSGGTLFSIVSTDKTFITEAEAAPSGECDDSPLGDYITRTLDAGDSTTDNSFYIDRIYIIVSLTNSSKVLTNVKINSIAVTADRIKYNTNTAYGFPYSSSHSIDVPFSPAFSCNYGTSKSSDYVMTATFINDYGDSYNLTFSFKITYNGARELTLWTPTEECIRTSGNNEAIAKFDVLNRSKYVFSQVISNTANTRAPAMTFGTRTGEDGMLSSAFGQGLYAEKDGEFVIGRYNNQELQTDSKYSFVIGNGLTEEHRSNALTIDWSGNICLGIDVTGSETDAELLTAIQNAGWESSVIE